MLRRSEMHRRMNPSVVRKLFNEDSAEEARFDNFTYQESLQQEKSIKWNFDFANEVPLEGTYKWYPAKSDTADWIGVRSEEICDKNEDTCLPMKVENDAKNAYQESLQQEKSIKWNFDFANEVPLEGTYKWYPAKSDTADWIGVRSEEICDKNEDTCLPMKVENDAKNAYQESLQQEKSIKWNFDFANEVPLQGTYEWYPAKAYTADWIGVRSEEICDKNEDTCLPMKVENDAKNAYQESLQQEKSSKWNFDFANEVPLQGTYEWYPAKADTADWIGVRSEEICDKNEDTCLPMKVENDATPRSREDEGLPVLRKQRRNSEVVTKKAIQRKINFD